MRVFVTGGSGFVGGRLISRLKEKGHTVRALARSEKAMKAVGALGAEPVEGDLSAVEPLAAGMTGCDWVIHSAARIHGKRRADFIEDNVRGTERMLEAARRAGVRRFVQVSTEATLLTGAPLENVDETRPIPERGIGPYGESKGRAEVLVLQCNSPDFTTVAVRPRFVWGAGDTSLLPQLLEAVKSGKFSWIDGGRYRTSTCHVENAVHGILLAAEQGVGGHAYFLTDGEPVEFRAFVSALFESAGVKPPKRSLPGWLAYPTAFALEALWSVTSPGNLPPLYREQLALIGQEVTVNDARARAELGYVPVITREQGLAELRL